MTRRRSRYDIAGRTTFVTGAARGIGAEAAARLHERGANVALVGLEPDRLAALAERLGDRCTWFEADVTDAAALERATAGTVERFGGIDVGIANAGIHFVGALATAPAEQVERVLEVNLMGVWRTDRALLPHVVERGGYLLNVASLAAVAHAPLMGPYAASKAGVEALTDCLRAELAARGARVGCAYFGFIDTDLVRTSFAHPSTRVIEAAMPGWLRRPAPLDDAVDAIERGIERRARRVWAPRYVGGALLVRDVLQRVVERRVGRGVPLDEAIRLAGPGAACEGDPDPLLGVSSGSSAAGDART